MQGIVIAFCAALAAGSLIGAETTPIGCHNLNVDWKYARAKDGAIHPLDKAVAAMVKDGKPFYAVDYDDGDWREELVLPGDKGDSLLVFTSPHPTKYRFWSFMLDPMYRAQVAAWNTAYNQAPQTGFYFGPDLLGHGIWFRGMYLP